MSPESPTTISSRIYWKVWCSSTSNNCLPTISMLHTMDTTTLHSNEKSNQIQSNSLFNRLSNATFIWLYKSKQSTPGIKKWLWNVVINSPFKWHFAISFSICCYASCCIVNITKEGWICPLAQICLRKVNIQNNIQRPQMGEIQLRHMLIF